MKTMMKIMKIISHYHVPISDDEFQEIPSVKEEFHEPRPSTLRSVPLRFNQFLSHADKTQGNKKVPSGGADI
jgi:hypothetical protein